MFEHFEVSAFYWIFFTFLSMTRQYLFPQGLYNNNNNIDFIFNR